MFLFEEMKQNDFSLSGDLCSMYVTFLGHCTNGNHVVASNAYATKYSLKQRAKLDYQKESYK